jgi:hypothetical protein
MHLVLSTFNQSQISLSNHIFSTMYNLINEIVKLLVFHLERQRYPTMVTKMRQIKQALSSRGTHCFPHMLEGLYYNSPSAAKIMFVKIQNKFHILTALLGEVHKMSKYSNNNVISAVLPLHWHRHHLCLHL